MWISEIALVGIGLGALLGTASGWVVQKLNHDKIDTQIPFAKIVRESVLKNKTKRVQALLVMMQAGTYTGEVVIGYINQENKSVFDLSKYGIGEHLVPESYVKPIIMDGIRVYFASYVDAEVMGIDEVLANNRLIAIQKELPNLRGIPISTLNTLLQQTVSDWETDCNNLLYNIRVREKQNGIEYCGIPETAEEFIELLMKAQKMLQEPAKGTSDYVLTTYESVIKHRVDTPIPKESVPMSYYINCIKAKLTKKPLPEKPKSRIPSWNDKTTTYEYKNMRKSYKGIKFLAPTEALSVRDSSCTVSAIQQYGMNMEQRGRLNASKMDGFMEKYGKYLMPIGIFVVICCVGLGILVILLNNNGAT